MKKILLFSLFLCSCSTVQSYWITDRNVSQQEMSREETECYMASLIQSNRDMSAFPDFNRKNFVECMETKGYKEEIR